MKFLHCKFLIILYVSLDQRNLYSKIDAGEAFGAKLPSTRYNLVTFWQCLGERSTTKKIGPFSREKKIHAMLRQLSVIMYL